MLFIISDDLMSEILDERSQDMVDLFAKEVNKYNLRYVPITRLILLSKSGISKMPPVGHMRPARLTLSLMPPPSPFEFEIPTLN